LFGEGEGEEWEKAKKKMPREEEGGGVDKSVDNPLTTTHATPSPNPNLTG